MNLYIDSNIFIFAAIDNTEMGRKCRKIIELIQKDRINCATSFLTVDEVLWVLKKKIGRGEAGKIVRATLSLPIRWIDVDRPVITNMLYEFKDSRLDPRDCIHLSSMKKMGITSIISEDTDFDGIEGIKRIDVSSYN